jgi:hypothetical protein
MINLNKRGLKHFKLMQYHELMARKHTKLARFQYTILVKIFNHDEDLLKKVLKDIGKENDEFCRVKKKK